MGKGPGLHTDIAKKARDLLNRDYLIDQKFTVTTCSPTGVSITSSGTNKGDLFLADVNTKLKYDNFTTDIKLDTNSNLTTTLTISEHVSGLKNIISFKLPDQRSAKMESHYQNEYAGIITGVGLNSSPIVNLSGVIGSCTAAIGSEIIFDFKTQKFTKCNVGFTITKADLISSITLNDKGNTLSASYYHAVSPVTAFAAEVSHSFSTNVNTIIVGTQHAWDPLTTVKARVNNVGKASALIQHQWRPKSLFTISGEVDAKSTDKSPKVGLALALQV